MIIGIRGKSQSDKDTIGNIIQYLTSDLYKVDNFTYEQFINRLGKYYNANHLHDWKIKKFGDKLKDIVCLLIGCTREQLGDEEFKNTELGKEWWYYKYYLHYLNAKEEPIKFVNIKTRKHEWKYLSKESVDLMSEEEKGYHNVKLVKLTPKDLLHLLGTKCGEDIIHPNIWINSLFKDYRELDYIRTKDGYFDIDYSNLDNKDKPIKLVKSKSNWIITDPNTLNEVKAIKDRGGIVIKVNRNLITKENVVVQGDRISVSRGVLTGEESLYYKNSEYNPPNKTALDNYKDWDYIIDNNGSIEELIEKVKGILIDLRII